VFFVAWLTFRAGAAGHWRTAGPTLDDVSWEIIALFAISGLGVGLAGRRVLHAADAAVPVWSCEALSVLLWSAVGWWWLSGSRPGWWLPVPLAVTAFAAPLLLADLRQLRLPNVLTLRKRRWQDGVPYGPGLLVVTWAIALVPGAGWP
jgi:hypothetical protein